MSPDNHHNEISPEYAALSRELEQPENRPGAPPPTDEFRLSLRRDLINRYAEPGLSRRAARRLWQFAGAAMGILLLGAALTYWLALSGRPEASAPAAAIQTVNPDTERAAGAATKRPDPESAPAGVVGTGRVWLVSVEQAARENAADPVTIAVEVGYELSGRAAAGLQVLYAAPGWSQNDAPFVEGEMRRVPLDSLTDNVPVTAGSDVLRFTFTGRPAEMQQIVGTDRPVLVAQLGYIAGEGEVVELKVLAMETFPDYPLDLTSTEEIVYRPADSALVVAAESGVSGLDVAENAGSDRLWLVSVIQKGRENADDPVTIELEVGYALATADEAQLHLNYAAPDWAQGPENAAKDQDGAPVGGFTDAVPVTRGSERLWFSFTIRPEDMRRNGRTDRPVIMVQLGVLGGEGERLVYALLAQETFGAYPLDLTSTEEIVHQPAWDALGIDACIPAAIVRAQPPDDPNADAFGEGPWYISDDRSLWLSAPPNGLWRAGGEKVAYMRPAGTDLQVTGRRLDADAPPLHADNPCCYPTGFQIGALIFPTAGCWEVAVIGGETELRVVTRVLPNPDPPAGGTCATPADAVAQSDAIILGEVLETAGDDRYAWHNVAVRQTYQRPAGVSGIGDRINLLQDLSVEPGLQVGERYILFVQQSPWQIHCPQQTIYHVQGEQVIGLGDAPLWPAGYLTDLLNGIVGLQE